MLYSSCLCRSCFHWWPWRQFLWIPDQIMADVRQAGYWSKKHVWPCTRGKLDIWLYCFCVSGRENESPDYFRDILWHFNHCRAWIQTLTWRHWADLRQSFIFQPWYECSGDFLEKWKKRVVEASVLESIFFFSRENSEKQTQFCKFSVWLNLNSRKGLLCTDLTG